jgi:DNA polymerase alpha subunit A
VHRYVLDQILSGNTTEEVVEAIHEYLQTISQNIRDGKIKMDEFIVFKVISKISTQRTIVHMMNRDWEKIQKTIQMQRVSPMFW